MLQKPKLFSRAFMVSNKMMMSTTIKLVYYGPIYGFMFFRSPGHPEPGGRRVEKIIFLPTSYMVVFSSGSH